MSAIEGASVACRTLADGTLRLSIDIEPAMAQAAFQLFGAPGRAVVVAALKDGLGAKTAQEAPEAPEAPTPSPEPEKPSLRTAMQAQAWDSLGPMTKAAITLSAAPEFWQWAGVGNSVEAGEWIKRQCDVETRKDLDTYPVKAALFRMAVLQPYQKHMAQVRGG